ncbi:hypothetical protein AYI69_g3643, partial [Smittium culicis]
MKVSILFLSAGVFFSSTLSASGAPSGPSGAATQPSIQSPLQTNGDSNVVNEFNYINRLLAVQYMSNFLGAPQNSTTQQLISVGNSGSGSDQTAALQDSSVYRSYSAALASMSNSNQGQGSELQGMSKRGTLPGNNNRYYTIPYLLGFFLKRQEQESSKLAEMQKRGTLPGNNNNHYYTIPYLLGFFQKRSEIEMAHGSDVAKRGTLPGNNNRYYTIPYLLGYFLKREEQHLSQGAKIVKRGTLPGNNNNRYYTIPYLLGFFQKRGGENFDAEVNEHLDDHVNYSYLTSPKLLEDIVQYKDAAGSDLSDISKRGTLPGNNNNHYYTIPYLLGFFQKRQDDVSYNQVAVGSEFSASESVGAQFLNL